MLVIEQHHKLESVNWQQDIADPCFEESIYICYSEKIPVWICCCGSASSPQSFLVLHLVTFHFDYNKKLSVWAGRPLTFYKRKNKAMWNLTTQMQTELSAAICQSLIWRYEIFVDHGGQ